MTRWHQTVCVFTFISLIYFLLATTLAMALYPGYDFFGQFLSALGASQWGFLFNSAVIVIGISTSLLYGTIVSQFAQESIKTYRFLFVASLLGFLSGILLIGVGSFVASGKTSDIHDFFAIAFFLDLLLFMSLFLIGFIRTPESFVGYKSRHGLAFTSAIISLSTAIGLFIPSVNQYLMQKIIVFLYVVFVFWLDYAFFSHHKRCFLPS